MPKILVDKSKEFQERRYAIKTCPVCESVIEISEREARNASTNKNGIMYFQCPCGQNLPLKKYFSGKKYTEQDYIDCLSHFKQYINNIVWVDLPNYMIGFGEYYFTLSHIQIIVRPIHIIIEIYVNKYEEGNWEHCLDENDFYTKYDLQLSELSTDLSKCAIYSQALSDYIVFCLDKLCKQRRQKLHWSVEQQELISFFRNADINITEDEKIGLCSDEFENYYKHHTDPKIF